MINFINIEKSEPYNKFVSFYDRAFSENQINIQAMCISSYSTKEGFVDSRFVNLKYIDSNKWTFFSNYNGPKSKQFLSHEQISILFYWNTIDVQVRMRANIEKTSSEQSDDHFLNRSNLKNALAISSSQSNKISSYEEVQKQYKDVLNDPVKLSKRPNYWGGYSFTPYYIEFWQGHESRINKREVFEHVNNGDWNSYFLQP